MMRQPLPFTTRTLIVALLLGSMADLHAQEALPGSWQGPDIGPTESAKAIESLRPQPLPAPSDRAESLNALLQRVLSSNPQVQVALAQWQATAQRRTQLLSRLGPSVSLTSAYGNSMERDAITPQYQRHTVRTEAGLRWNLYNAGNDWAEFKAATTELAAAAQDLRRAREDTSERLAESYVEVLRLQTVLPFAQARLNAVTQLVDQVKRQNAAGKTSDTDATQAEASLIDAQVQADSVTSDLESARAKLAAEVGTEVRDALPIALGPVPVGAEAGVPGLVEGARLKAQAARQRVRPGVSLLVPRIDLEVRNTLNEKTRPLPSPEVLRSWQLTARWEFPLLGESLARRNETEFRAEAALADAERLDRAVMADLKALDARISNGERALVQLDQQIQQYDRLLRAAEIQYEAGRRSLAQLIQLRESRFSIEQRRVDQDHKLLAARMRQLALTGALLPALGLPSLPSEVSEP